MKSGTSSERVGKVSGLARSAGSVSIAVFFSRILGLIREQVLAGFFGAGTAMDAFVVAFRIPNLLRDLFAEGALSSAFVTVFTDYEQNRKRQETLFLINNVLTVLTLILSGIVILGVIFSEQLVLLLAPDFAAVAGKVDLTKHLTMVMFPFLLLVSLSALVMGILNTRGHFFIPALASSCFNFASISVGVVLALVLPKWGYPAIFGMAIGTLAGGFAQMAIQWPLFRKQGFRIRPSVRLSDPGLKRIGRLILPAIIGLSATQINIFVNTNFASRCVEGSVSWLNYAFRLMQLPIGLFGVAISVATLPVLARHASRRELGPLGDTLVSSLNLGFALTIPAAVGLWVLAEPIVRVIFEHGRFTPADTVMTAQAVKFYAIGLFAYSAVKTLVPCFYALDDTRWPVIGSFLAVALNICLILIFLNVLQHRAIALATSVSMILNFLLLSVVLYGKVRSIPIRRLGESAGKIVFSAGCMGFVVYALNHFFRVEAGSGIVVNLFTLLFLILLGGAVYGGMTQVMRVEEVCELVSGVRKRGRAFLKR